MPYPDNVWSVKIIDGLGREVVFNREGIVIGIDYTHNKIHCGKKYFIENVVNITGSGTKNFLIRTHPSTDYLPHFTYQAKVGAAAEIELWENVTVDDNGTEITVLNRNRRVQALNLAQTVITENPVNSNLASATRIQYDYSPGGGNLKLGNGIRNEEEIILKENTLYLIRIKNLDTTTNRIGYSFDWYEDADECI